MAPSDKVEHPQLLFEKEVKAKAERDVSHFGPQPFMFHPPNYYRGRGILDVNKGYLHDVMICAPHLQFPDTPIPCECGGRFCPTQWADRRVIHGIDQNVSLLQYRYKCNGCKKTMVAGELLKTELCPDMVRLSSTKFYLTKNSGVTDEVMGMIMDGGVSKQSFDDIQLDLATRRNKRYLQLRTEYHVALDHYCKEKNISIEDMPAFSAMDDTKGYNVRSTEPASDYITDIFKAKVEEHKDVTATAFDDQDPCTVQSVDHTFNGPKRTCDHVSAQPPENLPPGCHGHSSYAAVEKNALLIAIGANGQVNSVHL